MSELEMELSEGIANIMGEGLFIVLQEHDGAVHEVCLTADDLRRMLERG